MSRITIDPNTLQAPDYTSNLLSAPRNALKAALPNLTDAEAAAALLNVWQADNILQKTNWTAQLAADALHLANEQQLEDDEQAARDALRTKELEDARDDERKKNRRKYVALVPRKKTVLLPRIPLPYATKRMEKGDWVPMWFFTPEGFKAASAANGSGDDDPMTLTRNDDGTLTTATSVKSPKGAIADRDITFEYFCLASVAMLDAMKAAGWQDERIAMFASFWSEIQEHPLRHTGDELDRRVLLLYQEEERRRWHHTVSSSADAPYDMSSVDTEILAEVKERVYSTDREKRFQMSVSDPNIMLHSR